MSERVSVLVCTYNYGRYLAQCLASVLNQTRPPDEVIVIDDESTDDTPQIMKRFPDVRYVRQENTGKAVAFGRAFSFSTGDVICHVDPDDYWEPRKLERVLACFTSNPNLGGVIHEARHVDASDHPVQLPWAANHPQKPMMMTLDESEDVGFLYPLPGARGCFFGVTHTTCIRRASLQDLLPMPPEVGWSVDGVLVAGALRFGLAYLPDALLACRIHGSNSNFGNVSSTQMTIDMWEFLLAHPNFRRFLSNRHAKLLRAKILERKAYMASRTGRHALAGAWAGMRIPWILAANGYRCSWKHLALPVTCLLPVKREPKNSRPRGSALRHQLANSSAPRVET